MSVYDLSDDSKVEEIYLTALNAVRDGKLIVLPTDTVYGIGADAFNSEAVKALLAAKGRDRSVPPPVLIANQNVIHALGVDIPEVVEDLVEAFWPGALTIIVKAQPSLAWDLGDTKGTVALRMPAHEHALEILSRTGPLAVSSANKHAKSPAKNILEAATQLGDAVEVYLDSGESTDTTASTIIDATVSPPKILRLGALTQETIESKLGPIFNSSDSRDTKDLDYSPNSESSLEAGALTGSKDLADTTESTEQTKAGAKETAEQDLTQTPEQGESNG